MEAITKEQILEAVTNLREAYAKGTNGPGHPPPVFIQALSDHDLIAFDIELYELALLAIEQRDSKALIVTPETLNAFMDANARLEADVTRWTKRVKLVEGRAELAKMALSGALDAQYALHEWTHGTPRLAVDLGGYDEDDEGCDVGDCFGTTESTADRYKGVAIRFGVGLEAWGGHERQEPVMRFRTMLARRLELAFPGAHVFVYLTTQPQIVEIRGETSEGAITEERAMQIELEVAEIGFKVWNEGSFW